MIKIRINKGQMLLELLIAIGLSTILIPILMISLISSRDGRAREVNQSQVVALLKETETAVKAIKNRGWSALPVSNTPYHLVIDSNLWTLVQDPIEINGLTQAVLISNVYRDTNGDIVDIVEDPSAVLDPSTKKITSTISWTKPNANSLSSTLYLTRTQNYSESQTTLADFMSGNLIQTLAVEGTPAGDGQVILGNNNKAKWCSPEFSTDINGNEIAIDLPGSEPPVSVVASAAANTSIPNDVLVAIAPNIDSAFKLAYLTTTANTATPEATLKGVFTLDPSKYTANFPGVENIRLNNEFKTNIVRYYKSPAGKTYALLGTTLDYREVIAILVNDGNPDNDNTNSGEFQDYQAVDGVNPQPIFKYWTYFNTRRYYYEPDNFTTNTGWANPSSNSVVSEGGFDSNPSGAYLDNGTPYAVDNNSGTGISTSCSGAGKVSHIYKNYNFSIPYEATSISGIEVKLDAKIDVVPSTGKMCVELSWDGGVTWTTTGNSTSALTTTLSTKNVPSSGGGSSNKWGRGATDWKPDDFTNANFRLRITNVTDQIGTRDFTLDWAPVRVTFTGPANTKSPYQYGASALTILGNTGYVASNGYLYVFNLMNIDDKSPTNGLDMLGCSIKFEGSDCSSGCEDGGFPEYYGVNDLSAVNTPTGKFVFAAIGAYAQDELNIANVSSVPSADRSNDTDTCGLTDPAWMKISGVDFNNNPTTTVEASNSVFAKSDGTRAYITSNGGILGGDGIPDSHQFYIINTENKSAPALISGSAATGGATSGYYYGGTVAQGATPTPAPTNTPTLTPTPGGPTPTPAIVSLWAASTTPANITENDPNAVELGVKFRPTQDGQILGIRFYKGPQNTGTHTGTLWSGAGTSLATATFANETASGWQEVLFSTPVNVTSGTTYVASYHTNTGYYSFNTNYFATDYTNGPLTAPSSGSSGGNGVYIYGAHAFPNQVYNATNYWVDVLFQPSGSSPTSTPTPTPTPTPGGSNYYNYELFPKSSLTVLDGKRAIIIGRDGRPEPTNALDPQDYQVLDLEGDEADIIDDSAYCGGLDYDFGFNGLTSVSEADSDNFVYMITNTTDRNLKIIQGGADDGIYIQSGQFESDVIEAPQSSVFNRFLANVELPGGSDIKLQVASAPKSGGVCPDPLTSPSSYLFIGKDNTSTSFFDAVGSSISAQIPFGTYGSYENPAQCFRYKAWLYASPNLQSTPVIKDFFLNYSQ